MKRLLRSPRRLISRPTHRCLRLPFQSPRRHVSTDTSETKRGLGTLAAVPVSIATGVLFVWWLYPSEAFEELSLAEQSRCRRRDRDREEDLVTADNSAWSRFSQAFESVLTLTDVVEWSKLSDSIVDLILPEWSKMVPAYLRKLQRELTMSTGSLADEIWQEAHDPLVNPEIQYSATVRVSNDLCDEEKQYLVRRRQLAKIALAKYLGIPEPDVHVDDVPVIAMCGSGGGLRALVATAGSLAAIDHDGLLDCLTYTAGVSGSCWLQSLYLSSISGGRVDRLLEHLKSRLGIHIAYPPVAFQSLVSAPTSKYLLSGIVEKLRGDRDADFGLVDIYGLLLAARLLVPKGELAVNERDFKLSNQKDYVKYGQHPLPIYTAVRHEIPVQQSAADGGAPGPVTEAAKEQAKRESWFQWFEVTPFEFFCEEFAAGIPTWALGRKFHAGKDVPPEHGFHLPEIRVPLLLGIFGSAFCATLSHYYREIRPIVRNISGLGTVDEMISGRNEDLSKVHPIDPAKIPNFVYGMDGGLAPSTPDSVCKSEYLQLMDAGMSNNLPIYPLLRPGRNVEILLAFDASADMKTDNWLAIVEGYTRQRGLKGWPIGAGWPRPTESPEETRKELEEAQAKSVTEAELRLSQAKEDQAVRRNMKEANGSRGESGGGESAPEDLGYCTVWVGTTEERQSAPPPHQPPKAITSDTAWRLMEPHAGVAVVYLPFLANPRVPGVMPNGAEATDFVSTWNFVYTPEQVEDMVLLARANYDEGREQIRACVRAVYERKKKSREDAEERAREQRFRRRVRRGLTHKYGQGDHFS